MESPKVQKVSHWLSKFLNLAIFRGPILSMVTVGAYYDGGPQVGCFFGREMTGQPTPLPNLPPAQKEFHSQPY